MVDQKNSCTALLYAAKLLTEHQHQIGDSLIVTGHLKENSERLGCHKKVLGHLHLLKKNKVGCIQGRKKESSSWEYNLETKIS